MADISRLPAGFDMLYHKKFRIISLVYGRIPLRNGLLNAFIINNKSLSLFKIKLYNYYPVIVNN